MENIKSRLLAPSRRAFPVTLLGNAFFIRRLTAYELAEYEDETERLRQQNDTRAMALTGAALILSALVDESGCPESNLPSPEELMKTYSYADLIDALGTVQRNSYGTLEEAKKN